jgi:hypothetical protein
MKKRFIVALNASTPEAEKAIVAFLKRHGVSWWHWLRNVWLVSDSEGKLSAKEIRDGIREILPGVNSFVIQLNSDGSDTWSGFGPKSDDKDMFSWIHKNWKK